MRCRSLTRHGQGHADHAVMCLSSECRTVQYIGSSAYRGGWVAASTKKEEEAGWGRMVATVAAVDDCDPYNHSDKNAIMSMAK